MKKRLHGLLALLLAMIMVIPSVAQAAPQYEYGAGPDEEYKWWLLDDYYCLLGAVPTTNHFSEGDEWNVMSGGTYIQEEVESNTIKEMSWVGEFDDDTVTIEYYLWKHGFYDGEPVVFGTPTKLDGSAKLTEELYDQYSYSFEVTDGSDEWDCNVSPVIETYIQPNYTVPQGLTAKCGQTLADIEFPVEATTFSDGTPIGTWVWADDSVELTEEGTVTAKAIFKAFHGGYMYYALNDDDNDNVPVSPLWSVFVSGKEFPVTVEVEVIADVAENPSPDDYKHDEDGHHLTCENCGNPTDTEPHVFGEGTIIKEPTEDEDGEKTLVCTVCGYTTTEVIKHDSSSSEDKDTPDKDDTPADDTGKDDSSTKDDTNKDNSSTDKDSSKDESDESSDKDSNPTENAPSAPQNPANTGDAMNIALIAIAMIMALGCVIAVRKKEN